MFLLSKTSVRLERQNVRVQAHSIAIRPRSGYVVNLPTSRRSHVFPLARRLVKVRSSGGAESGSKKDVILTSGNGSGAGGSASKPLPGGGDNHPLRVWAYVFAITLLGGGAIAFFRKRSVTSLVAGSVAAAAFFCCGHFLRGPTALVAARAAFAASTLLGLAMGRRFYASKKFMPAGLVASFAFSSAVWFAYCGL